MKRYLPIFLLIFLFACKFPVPEALKTQTCNNGSISLSPDLSDAKKFNFSIIGASEIKYPITWQNNQGTTIGTSTTNSFSYTFPTDGSYIVKASFQTICGDNVDIATNSISINTQLSVERSFELTQPMASNLSKVAVTDDEKIIASDNGIIKVWQIQNQIILRAFIHPGAEYITNLLLSPDEKYLFTTGSNSQDIIQWDWKTGDIIKKINVLGSNISNLKISSDGNFLIYSFKEINISVWRINLYNLVKGSFKEYSFNNEYPLSLSLTANGDKFAVALQPNHKYSVFDSEKGTELWNYSPDYFYSGIAISNDGKNVFIQENRSGLVENWDIEKNILLKTISSVGPEDPGPFLISNDSKFLLFGSNLYDIVNGKTLWGHNNNNGGIIFNSGISNKSKYIVTSSYDGFISLVNLLDGSGIIGWGLKHSSLVNDSFVGFDNQFLCTLDINGVKTWDISNGKMINNGYNQQKINKISKLGYSTNSFWVKNNYILKYQYGSGNLLFYQTISNPDEGSFACSKNEKYIAFNENQSYKVRIFDAENAGEIINYSTGNTGEDIIFSNDGNYLITNGRDNFLKVFDIAGRQIIKTYALPYQSFHFLTSLNKSNKIAYPSTQGIKTIDIITGEDKVILPVNLRFLCFNPNDTQLTGVSNENELSIYDLITLQKLKFKSLPDKIVKVQYNSTGTQIFITTIKEFYIITAP